MTAHWPHPLVLSNSSDDERTLRSRQQRRIRERFSAYREERRRNRLGHRPPPRVAFPSFFTLMNLLSGFLALTQIQEGAFVMACWLIVLAGFFDLLDGMMARLTDAVSPFGVELDSLSDIVSFGVAPGYLVYVFGLQEFGPLGMIVASLPALCGAVRLARYNLSFDGEKKDYFEGLPIPVQAMAIVALILNVNDAAWFSRYSMNNLSMLIPIVFLLSGLMVSTIQFDAIPKPTVSYIRRRPKKVAAYGLAVLVIVVLQQIGLLVVLGVYLLHGLGMAVYRLVDALTTPVPGERPTPPPDAEH